jgi:hypothetical protein
MYGLTGLFIKKWRASTYPAISQTVKILESAPVEALLSSAEGLSAAALGHIAWIFGLVLVATKHFIQSERLFFGRSFIDIAAIVIPLLVVSLIGLPFGVVGNLFDWLHELSQSQSIVACGAVLRSSWLTVVRVVVVGVGEVGVVVIVGLTL